MRNPPFRPLPKLALKAFLILFTSSLNFAQQPREIFPSYPTGALAVFPESVQGRAYKVGKIYFRSLDGSDPVIWVAEPQSVLLPDLTPAAGQPLKTESAIGFFVPQLPRGNYIAWYESSAKSAQQSMKLAIVPALLTDQGIERAAPGGEVEVRIKISSPNVSRQNVASPDLVKAAITLKSSNPAVADLSQGQTALVSTNREGFALWKIHVNKAGIAEFTGTADGFEPVTIIVVGMPAAAPTFLEAALLAATLRAEQSELAAAVDFKRALELDRAADEKREALEKRQGAKEVGRPTPGVRETESRELREAREADRNSRAASEVARATNEQAVAAQIEVRGLAAQVALQPRSITEADLKPGDILLVRGTTPLISTAITSFEKLQLGGVAPYSHAAIYLGKINGVGKVAEMLFGGFSVSSLKESTQSDLLVDVYRWEGINDAKRQEIAKRAASPYGLGIDNGVIAYALAQIEVLSYVVTTPSILGAILGSRDLRALMAIADSLSGGRRQMICSELVAWVYRDAGLDVEVIHWKKLRDLNLLTSEDRRRDYTTPNMLARSTSLHIIGRYLGP